MIKKIKLQTFALGLMALLLVIPSAKAQYMQNWVAQYNGPSPTPGWDPADYITDMTLRDGYVYVTGYESQFTAYSATVKYDYSGQEIWVRRLVDGQSQHAEAIIVDDTGNVYVTNYQKVFGAGIDVVTQKFNSDGDSLWYERYNNPAGNHDTPNDMAFDASGNIYIAGASDNDVQDEFDFLLLKYDPAGNLLWDRTFDDGEENWDAGLALAIDPDGNAIVAGFTEPEAMLVKYSPTGDLLWYDKHVSYAPWDQWAQVITDATGNIYVLGEISLPGTPKYLWTVKYDPNGNILWEQPYTGTADESCYDGNLALMPDGGVVVTGQSWEVSGVSIVTIRYASDGTELWQQLELAGYAHTSGDDVAVDAQGRIYVTGYGYNYSYQEDIITLGYSPDGDLLWTEIYANTQPDGSDYPQAIAVDEDLNVIVAAHSWTTGTSNDYTTIMYTPDTIALALQVVADPAEICLGDGSQLMALPSGGTWIYTYEWTSDPPGFTSSESEPMVYPTENTSYFCEVDDGENTLSEQTTVSILLIPEVPEMPMGETSLCFGEYQTVYVTDGSVGSNSYTWTLQPEDAGMISGSDLTATVIWNEDFTGMAEISVAGVNACGESEMSEVLEVMMNELPVVDLGEDIEVCANEVVLLDAGNPGATYLWSTGETTQTIEVDSTGVGIGTVEVWVEVTDAETCMNSDEIMITFYDCTGISEVADNWTINIFPNPSKGQFAIELKSKSSSPVQLSIFNAFGSEVYKEDNVVTDGTSLKTLNLNDLPEGIYYLNLNGDGVNIIKKIVIN